MQKSKQVQEAAGTEVQAAVKKVQQTGTALLDEVGKVIVGKRHVMENVLVNILSQGNILFEDFPGLAKTVMASTFARASGCDFKRIQFTPDVLPADITGSNIYNQTEGTFTFRPGPLFTNILLGDEINRAPPKTQSAMLEAMQEKQVTVEGKTYRLERPYLVMATQNPVEQEGTYPLPEAQMDRFMMKLSVGYPDKADETEIAKRRIKRGKDDFDVEPVTNTDSMVGMQETCEKVFVHDAVLDYISQIVVHTREHDDVLVGSSPRGTLALVKTGRALAAMRGRTYVTPDDVRNLAPVVIAHRIILKPDVRFSGKSNEEVVEDILRQTPAPTT